jgi:hypothetical protein
VIGLTDTGILKWILVCSGARLGIRCKINEKTQTAYFPPQLSIHILLLCLSLIAIYVLTRSYKEAWLLLVSQVHTRSRSRTPCHNAPSLKSQRNVSIP